METTESESPARTDRATGPQASQEPDRGPANPRSDCLFCRIVAGEIPAKVVGQTAETLAFRDISPAAPTHILVIPKAHFDNLDEAVAADPGVAAAVLTQAAAIAQSEGLAKGYRIVINTGRYGGQTVDHLHAHLLGGRPHSWPPG